MNEHGKAFLRPWRGESLASVGHAILANVLRARLERCQPSALMDCGAEEGTVDHIITDLNQLVAKGKTQGYLTYDQANAYLPDEAVNPEKLDNLLMALDEAGIELLTDPPADGP